MAALERNLVVPLRHQGTSLPIFRAAFSFAKLEALLQHFASVRQSLNTCPLASSALDVQDLRNMLILVWRRA